MPKYISTSEVCEMLGIGRRSLERYRLPNGEGDADREPFPEPALHIKSSPRWEETELIEQLKTMGHKLGLPSAKRNSKFSKGKV